MKCVGSQTLFTSPPPEITDRADTDIGNSEVIPEKQGSSHLNHQVWLDQ